MTLEKAMSQPLPLERGYRGIVEYNNRILLYIRVVLINVTGLGISYLAYRYAEAFAVITSIVLCSLLLLIGLLVFRVQTTREHVLTLAQEFESRLDKVVFISPGGRQELRKRFWRNYKALRELDRTKNPVEIVKYYTGFTKEVNQWLTELETDVHILRQFDQKIPSDQGNEFRRGFRRLWPKEEFTVMS